MSADNQAELPLLDDSITADDTGFSSSVDANFENDGVEAIKAEVAEAIENGASKEEIKEMIKEYELKVNGKTVKRKVDLGDEENVKRILQREMAGQEAMQEAAQLKKLYSQEIDRLKQNPWEVLKELGLDPSDLAEKKLREDIEELKKTPEQIENERIRRELQEYRQKMQNMEKQAEQARFEQLQNEAAVELETEIQEALKAYTTLPSNQMVIEKIADHMLWAIENAEKLGINPDDIRVSDVLPSVEKEINSRFNEFFDMLGEDAFEKYIGKRNVERMRKKRLNTMKTNNVSNIKESTEKLAEESSKPGKQKVRSKDFFKTLGRN